MARADAARRNGDAVGRGASLGRPRDPAIDDAVLDAARELLLEVGYTRLNFDMIARRAEVGRPAIYRRWPSKTQLVFDAVFQPAESATFEGIRDSGDFAADLLDFVRQASNLMARPVAAAAVPGLLADFHSDPTSLAEILARSWALARSAFHRRVKSAVKRGEIVGGTNPDVLLDAVIGGVIFHVVIMQQPPRSFAKSLTRLVVGSLLEE